MINLQSTDLKEKRKQESKEHGEKEVLEKSIKSLGTELALAKISAMEDKATIKHLTDEMAEDKAIIKQLTGEIAKLKIDMMQVKGGN